MRVWAVWRGLLDVVVISGLLAAIALASACGKGTQEESTAQNVDKPYKAFGNFTSYSNEVVWANYEYAEANPEVLRYIPCYCGCVSQGHADNRQCYISGVAGDGRMQYERHAVGCLVCIGITRDVMQLVEEGKSLKEIRSYIDANWSQYGPGTRTPLPPGE